LKARGLLIKINTVVLPGINVDHIEAIAQETSRLGADVMNCISVIPVPDTPFEHLKAPADVVMDSVRSSASLHIAQMYHCQRCRADAEGLLCPEEGHLSLFDQQSRKEPVNEHNG
jgi:nitrogen fixation protein NifB